MHKEQQNSRIAKTKGYADNNLIVADKFGKVPDLKYVRKYLSTVAEKAGVSRIPPKNLRSTHISLLNDLNIPLATIQKQVGHASPTTTSRHYIRTFNESLEKAIQLFNERLHS